MKLEEQIIEADECNDWDYEKFWEQAIDKQIYCINQVKDFQELKGNKNILFTPLNKGQTRSCRKDFRGKLRR